METFDVKEGVEYHFDEDDTDIVLLVGVIVAVIAAVLGTIYLVYHTFVSSATKKGPTGPALLLTGTSGAGKTSLFRRLLGMPHGMTFLSRRENIQPGFVLSESSGKTMNLVDLPGAERIRLAANKRYMPTARGIIVVIDSSAVISSVRDIAEALFEIFAETPVQKMGIPILIVCNKQDVLLAQSATKVRKALSTEINLTRKTREASLESTGASAQQATVGDDDTDFDFDQLPNDVQFVECSVKQGKIDAVEKWLAQF
eukprot:Clim_evm30s149 gene=Clim_evmTU30s149